MERKQQQNEGFSNSEQSAAEEARGAQSDSDHVNSQSKNEELQRAAGAVAGHVIRLLVDSRFRRDLRSLATAILDVVAEPPDRTTQDDRPDSTRSAASNSPTGKESPETNESAAEIAQVPDYVPAAQAIEMLDLGGSLQTGHRVASFAGEVIRHATDDLEYYSRQLRLITERCELKSDAARWAAERRRRMEKDDVDFATEIEPMDKEVIARAKEFEQCFLWTNHPSGPEPRDLDEYETLADCFDSLSEAARVLDSALDVYSPKSGNDYVLDAMQLLAEAQSALRVAVVSIGYGGDQDQRDAFQLLQSMAQRFGPVARYMRTSDTAMPEDNQELREKINRLDAELADEISKDKDRRKLLSKIRYEAKRVRQDPDEFPQRSRKIVDSVRKLTASGMQPSDVEVRESLLPLVDRFDEVEDSLPDEMVRLLREMNRFLARNPTAEANESVNTYSDEVRQVAQTLQGKKMMMIGGERRRPKQEAIRDAFQLEEFIWDTTHDHTSLDRFLPTIRRDDVAVVLLAIRWSSHSYSELENVCRQLGKPFVRLPGGTSPNQIAKNILEQAGKRLSELQ